MTTTITEGGLAFDFPDSWEATKYDDWAYYRNRFQNTCDSKAVDILALEPGRGTTLWIIEIKDYRRNRRTKGISLWGEVSQKVRDTLAGILAAGAMAPDDAEAQFARQCRRARMLRVVLHLEQPSKISKLFPRAFNPADVQSKLKRCIKAVDPHPRVLDRRGKYAVGWTVTKSGV